MLVEDIMTMSTGHLLGAEREGVEDRPNAFHRLAVEHARAGKKVHRVLVAAFFGVHAEVILAHARDDLRELRRM